MPPHHITPIYRRLHACHEPKLPLFAITKDAPVTLVARLGEGSLISGSETCTVAQVPPLCSPDFNCPHLAALFWLCAAPGH